jgi:DNA-binding NarL/FixJ family response regulator
MAGSCVRAAGCAAHGRSASATGGRQIALAKRLSVPDALGLSTEEWVRSRLGGYIRMSIEDRREAVTNLTDEGYSTREVGEILGVSNATVSRDVTNVTADKQAYIERTEGGCTTKDLTSPIGQKFGCINADQRG